MKNIEIKLIQANAKGTKNMTVKTVMTKLQDIFDKPYQYYTIYFPKSISTTAIKRAISKKYKDQIEISSGVSGGCYGARTGKQFEGLTLWCSPDLLPDRVVEPARASNDNKATEYVNIYKLLIEAGGEIVEGLEGETFEELCEDLGLDAKANNTYNYENMNEGDPVYMFSADYAVVEGSAAWYLSIKFHCGGDIRGNYTDKIVMKFNNADDMFSALQPSCQLIDESEA